MSSLASFLNRRVVLITTSGEYFVGVLDGFDHSTNLVLRESLERKLPGGDEPRGLLVVRGELVACIGLVDNALNEQIDWSKISAPPLGTTRHRF